jgi:hypothetical protein
LRSPAGRRCFALRHRHRPFQRCVKWRHHRFWDRDIAQICNARSYTNPSTLPPSERNVAATRSSPTVKQEGELAVRRIIKANIDRFKLLLKTETDPTKRAIEARLLSEEEEKLNQLTEANEKKAY